MIPRAIQSMYCSKNHLGIRCAAVYSQFSTLESESALVNSGSASQAAIVNGTGAPTELFGLALNATEQQQFTGMCGQFEAAGCCLKSAVGMAAGFTSMVPNMTEADNLLASFDNSTNMIRQVCASSGHTRTSNIGARACPIATVRNGAISNAAVPNAPVARAIRRRLRMTFGGDLNQLSAAQKVNLKASIKEKIEEAVGAGTVESVELSSGSIVATVTFTSDVEADEVSALETDVSITQMRPTDGETTFEQSSAPGTVDSSSESSGATIITATFGFVVGLMSTVAML